MLPRNPDLPVRLACTLGLWGHLSAWALNVYQYDPAACDRFSAGWGTATLTPNTNAAFIGKDYDWSGVGWDDSLVTRGVALVSPGHVSCANHWHPAQNQTLSFWSTNLNQKVTLQYGTQSFGRGPADTEDWDLWIGTLVAPAPLPAGLTPYRLLDCAAERTAFKTNTIQYGRGSDGSSSPRIGRNRITGYATYDWGWQNIAYFNTTLTNPFEGKAEGGDSGSPIFVPWKHPVTGQPTLTLVGAHAGTSFHSFLPDPLFYPQINAMMDDTGYALRWLPSTIAGTWASASNTDFGRAANWSGSAPAATNYFLFDGAAAVTRAISLNGTSRSVRGLYFKSAPGNNGFTISPTGGETLTLGRGGIVNLDDSRQTFNVPLVAFSKIVTNSNYPTNIFSYSEPITIEGGSGGIDVTGSIHTGPTNGGLLAVDSSGDCGLGGAITGTGGLAKDGSGTLTLSSSGNTFPGGTFVHRGTLRVANAAGSATGSGSVTVRTNAALTGPGRIAGAVSIQNGGTLAPGDSLGTLTISNALTLTAGCLCHVEINAATGASDLVAGLTSVSYAGTLVVTNLAGTVTNGQPFQLFGAASFSGNFASITSNVPEATWVFNPTNGLLTASVAPSISTTPTNITVLRVEEQVMELSWSASHTGWELQTQTNSLAAGLGTNWVSVADSTTTNRVLVPLAPGTPAVFFRLRWP
jgi:autotransporter-associated beta strand protein